MRRLPIVCSLPYCPVIVPQTPKPDPVRLFCQTIRASWMFNYGAIWATGPQPMTPPAFSRPAARERLVSVHLEFENAERRRCGARLLVLHVERDNACVAKPTHVHRRRKPSGAG